MASGVAPACFLSGISGWFSLSLYPLARGGRRIWRGEVWKYGFGGAVADFGLVISGSRRRPRRSQGRGQFATTRSHRLAEGPRLTYSNGRTMSRERNSAR